MRIVVALILSLLGLPAIAGETVIVADRDATLIEDVEGDVANGAGPSLFVGRNNRPTGSVRRALVRFDVTSAVPRRAIVERVELILTMNPSNPAPAVVSLRRVQSPWSEGPSVAFGGGGTTALPGDTTWRFASFDELAWRHPGGDALGRVSASRVVVAPGVYTWSDDVHLLADVRLWLANPSRNFGWLLSGNEAAPQTAKNFASREDPDPDARPRLRVVWRMPGD